MPSDLLMRRREHLICSSQASPLGATSPGPSSTPVKQPNVQTAPKSRLTWRKTNKSGITSARHPQNQRHSTPKIRENHNTIRRATSSTVSRNLLRLHDRNTGLRMVQHILRWHQNRTSPMYTSRGSLSMHRSTEVPPRRSLPRSLRLLRGLLRQLHNCHSVQIPGSMLKDCTLRTGSRQFRTILTSRGRCLVIPPQ